MQYDAVLNKNPQRAN